jgi:ketol-acid reductoisomerase
MAIKKKVGIVGYGYVGKAMSRVVRESPYDYALRPGPNSVVEAQQHQRVRRNFCVRTHPVHPGNRRVRHPNR